MVDALRMDEKRARGPVGPAFEQRPQAAAVEGHLVRFLQAAQVDEGRQQVDVGGDVGDVSAGGKLARPADEAGDAMAAVVFRALEAAHAGVEAVLRILVVAGRGAVVGHEDHDGVVFQAQLLEPVQQPADVLVDVGDHAVEVGPWLRHALLDIGLAVLVGDVVGRMRRVGGDVGEERPVLVLLDEPGAAVKKTSVQ